jgi:hypothetical protein
MLVIACPNCSKKYRMPIESVGKSVRCRSCQRSFKISAENPSAPEPAIDVPSKSPVAALESTAKSPPTLNFTLIALACVALIAVSFGIWIFTRPSRSPQLPVQSSSVASVQKVDAAEQNGDKVVKVDKSKEASDKLEEASDKWLTGVKNSFSGMLTLVAATQDENGVKREEAQKGLDEIKPLFEKAIGDDRVVAKNWSLFVTEINVVDGVPQISSVASVGKTDNTGGMLTFVFIDKENKHREKIAILRPKSLAIFSGTATGKYDKVDMFGLLLYTVYFTIDEIQQ